MTRVLIAEAQTLYRQTLRVILDADPDFEIVGEAASGNEAIAKIPLCNVDSLIMNMSLPGISGVDLIVRAKAINPNLSILVSCLHYDDQLITQALKNGASGYISVMRDLNEFLTALRKISCGGCYIDPSIAENMLLNNISDDDKPIHSRLSPRELQVFRLLAAGKSLNAIADQLIVSNKTVSSHKKKLFEKMHFSGMADLMRYALQRELFDDRNNTNLVIENISDLRIPSDF